MARTKRICPAGEVFHVLNRAVARLTIFEKPEDYAAFMRVVEETWEIVPLPIYATKERDLTPFFPLLLVQRRNHRKVEAVQILLRRRTSRRNSDTIAQHHCGNLQRISGAT
jgi:hypothetical protein